MKKDLHTPPRWADRFLEWYCRPELLEEIQGDIYELFDLRCKKSGIKAARRRYGWDVIRSFRLSTIKGIQPNHSTMLMKSNFKIALRQMSKQKLYSAIKIGGFALGIAVCLLIGLFIRDELSYDRHYPQTDHIYRVIGIKKESGEIEKNVYFPAPFAKALKEDYPEIKQAGRFLNGELFGAGSKQIRPEREMQNHFEEGFVFIDQALLDLWEVPMVYGNPKEVLSQPNTLVISKRIADKYFPGENPVGKSMIINNFDDQPQRIGGVMENLPRNSHFQSDFLQTLTEVEFWPGEQNFWRASNYHTYVLLQPGTDVSILEQKLRSILKKYLLPAYQEVNRPDAEKYLEQLAFELQPIQDIHLKSEGIYDNFVHSDIRYIWLFGSIAIVILLLACINFINLSTARSANRAKEVGLRKVVGSFRTTIIGQFLTESLVFSGFSFIIGLTIARGLLPFFNQLSGKSLAFPWYAWWFVPSVLLASVIIGLVAGIYPAFYLSGFRPISVLKGNLSNGAKSSGLRNTLVVFQFSATIILLISTFVVYQQMNYILHKKLGFEKEQIVLLQGAQTKRDQVASLKQELLQLPEVSSVSVSDYLPIKGTKRNGNGFWIEGKVDEDQPVPGQYWRVDHDYIKTMGMTIVEGRDFSINNPTDSQAIIINQALADKLGLKDPVGKRITNSGATWPILGVVENFHFESLRENIRPLAMTIGNSPNIVSVKVNSSDMNATLDRIRQTWGQFYPNQSIRYTFLDDSFARMYEDVQRTGDIFTSFALFAIVVACLGLFALSTFMAEQRSKEIGIRKVLGASVGSILQLQSRSFMSLVLLAMIISIPIGWYAMQRWLEDFSYRIELQWWIFALAGLTAILIAGVTVSFQALRSATANPVHALRNE